MPASHATLELDHLDIAFDDRHAVANAGLLLAATLADRLGIAQAADEYLRLQGPGAANPGTKLLTLVHGMLAGGDCIDDVDVLRCGATANVLGHRVMAPTASPSRPAPSGNRQPGSSATPGRRGPLPNFGGSPSCCRPGRTSRRSQSCGRRLPPYREPPDASVVAGYAAWTC